MVFHRILLIFIFILVIPRATWAQEIQSKQATTGTGSGITHTRLASENISAEPLPPLPPGPLLLTSTTPEQLSPDYWINRLPNPDRILKTQEELKLFNQEIRMMIHERVDIFAPGILPRGEQIRGQIKLEYETVSDRILFDVQGARIPKSFFSTRIRPIDQWERIPDQLASKWGAATRATSVRALPTSFKMLEEVGDIEFDQLQFTLIKLWTPVVILHTSTDGKWFYVQAPYVRGWVKSRDIAVFPNNNFISIPLYLRFAKRPSILSKNPFRYQDEDSSLEEGPCESWFATVAAVYDRRQSCNFNIAGGHRPPLEFGHLGNEV